MKNGGSMTYQELIKNLSHSLDVSQAEIRRLLKDSFDVLVETIDSDKTVTIPDLGTLQIKLKDEHKSYSPFHKKYMLLPKKRIIAFHPGLHMKDQLKDKRIENE